MKKLWALAAVAAIAAIGVFASLASADTIGPITFEPPSYTVGDINGQQGWQKSGPYDVSVVDAGSFPLITAYGFGTQALRSSDAVTSGSFGDQTFSPGLANPSSESSYTHFEASFSIGSAVPSQQGNMHLSVSPDKGDGSRMSYLRFEDHADGIHVFFDDVTDPGPFPTVATFNESDIATFAYGTAHTFKFAIDLKPGPANDVVKIYMDGSLIETGTTWEDYYRYDPEQIGNGNQVPNIDKLLFREAGDPDPGNAGGGYLIDNVSLASHQGTGLTTATQAMDGDLKVAQGSTLSAGFDFTMPGKHPSANVGFNGTTVTFNATCASGTSHSQTIVVSIPDQSYADPANSSAWYPSGDQNSAMTYQGSATVPSFCDPGALVRLQKGGTFSTFVTSDDTTDKVNVRWHYMDGTGGGWSGTYSVIPS